MSGVCEQPLPPSSRMKPDSLLLTKGQEEEGEGKSASEEEEEEEEDDDLLAQSMEDEVGELLRSTVQELETALQDSRKMLVDRDEEISRIKMELDRYKTQVAREIANKTKLAQSLDASLSAVSEMEELTQEWQLEVKVCRQQGEKLKSQLAIERTRSHDLEVKLEEVGKAKVKEVTQLSAQLVEARQELKSQRKNRGEGGGRGGGGAMEEGGIDQMQFHFLKQAVYHLLTEFHAEDQLRAISSILQFSPQEKKAVYSKFAERRK